MAASSPGWLDVRVDHRAAPRLKTTRGRVDRKAWRGAGSGSDGETMFTCEILGVFFAMAAGRLPGRRAVRRQPTEKYTFDVSVNKRRRLGELTSAHWCAGDLWAVVSAERNATIVRFPLAGAMHLKYKPEEKGSFLRPFDIKVHGTWSFLGGWVTTSGRIKA